MRIKMIGMAAAAIVATVVLAGCSNGGTSADQATTDRQLQQYQKVQPLPFFDWSQYRETLLSIEQAQATGKATTSFFFLMGVDHPIKSCPSVGYPVPSTAQASNPDQAVNGNGAVIGQMEPTGVYTGNSTGTYVVCIIGGKAVPTYWEGEVHTEGSPAKWDDTTKQIVDTGEPTVTIKTGK